MEQFNRIAIGLAAELRRIVLAFAIFANLTSLGWAQSCTITGGTNFGTITQNCVINPTPAPLSVVSEKFEVIPMPEGNFRHQIFVQVGATINLLAVACGDGVLDVHAAPFPAGTVSVSGKITNQDCVAYRFFNTALGRWAIWVTTKARDTKFILQPIVERP
jgi:hypothetical protein